MKVTTLTEAQKIEIAVLQKNFAAAQNTMQQAHIALQTGLRDIVGGNIALGRNLQISEDGKHIIF